MHYKLNLKFIVIHLFVVFKFYLVYLSKYWNLLYEIYDNVYGLDTMIMQISLYCSLDCCYAQYTLSFYFACQHYWQYVGHGPHDLHRSLKLRYSYHIWFINVGQILSSMQNGNLKLPNLFDILRIVNINTYEALE